MTCIVGLLHDGKIFMGGDRAVSNGYDSVQKMSTPKVFIKNEKFIIGCSGPVRMMDLIKYSLVIPPKSEGMDDKTFIYTTLVNSIRECFDKNGYAYKNNNHESHDGYFMVGYNGSLYVVHGDFSITETESKYRSIGSGYEYALGSLSTTDGDERYNSNPEDRIRKSICSASKFNAWVDSNIDIISL